MNSWNGNLDQTDVDQIKELLIGRKVINVENDIMALDNGTVLRIIPNEGCGGCNSGWYYLKQLNKINNAITNVEVCEEDIPYDENNDEPRAYRIYVYADGIVGKQTLLSVEGDDGNGYYGTGYEIEVVMHGVNNG